ncbi:probable glutamate receptor isoform X2 [Macrobrachium rosenbergii]|uniref:probable glutamate receptor isoform X2 n=1 Tax=Macrobrachium rosenbergii TaxID=79674 RepID=UPI0034D53B76
MSGSYLAAATSLITVALGFLATSNADQTNIGNVSKEITLQDSFTETSLNHLHHFDHASLETKFSQTPAMKRRVDGGADEIELQNLIEFLFNGSTGRNVYFFYDHADAAVTASASMCYARGAEVTVFNCKDAVKAIESIIMSFNELESIRNIFVLCSSEVTQQLFREIYFKYLESALTHWFVILEEDILKPVTAYMREGTQVTFALRIESGLYHLWGSYINIKNKAALHDLGWWSWNPTSGAKHLLKRPLYRPVLEVYRDFGGRELIVTVIDNWPFWHLTYPGDGRVIPTSGLDYNVLKTVGDHLNFTFRMEITPDGKWGGVMADGTVTGMVGVVHRHEAHAAINEFTITEQREKAVDFTKPYYYESTTLISPAPSKTLRSYAVFTSFTYEVWIALIVVELLIGPLIRLLVWTRKKLFGEVHKKWEYLPDVSLFMFRPLVNQGGRVPSPKWFYRLVFIGYFFFSFLMISLYADVMISVLAVPSYEKPIDSLYDLLEAIEKDHYVTVLGCGSNNEFIYSNTTMEIYKQIYARFDHSKGCIKNWDDGMDRVLQGKYAFSNNRLGAEVRANVRGREKFHFAAHEFYAHGYSIACPNGSPYKTAFEEVLVREMTYGLVQKYTRDELEKARKIQGVSEQGPEPINIRHLQAACYLWLFGNFLGGCAVIAETIVKRHTSPGSDLGK